MHVSAHLTAIGAPTPVTSYLVRIWVPGRTALQGWRTADWRLRDVESVDEAISWERGHAAGSTCEVLLIAEDGAPLRRWGAEPDDASTSVTVLLSR